MDWWLYFYIFTNLILITFTTNIGPIRTLDAQQDERVRLECTVTSKLDAEEVCVEYYFIRLNDFIYTGGESITSTYTYIDYRWLNELMSLSFYLSICLFLGYVDAHSTTKQS